MRFQRTERSEYVATSRKSAAILRRQKRERDALPLFAHLVAAEQVPVDVEHERRRQSWIAYELKDRASKARDWRRARAALRTFPSPEHERLRNHWNNHRWYPATAGYLLTMLHMYLEGRLNMEAPNMTIIRPPRPIAASIN